MSDTKFKVGDIVQLHCSHPCKCMENYPPAIITGLPHPNTPTIWPVKIIFMFDNLKWLEDRMTLLSRGNQ